MNISKLQVTIEPARYFCEQAKRDCPIEIKVTVEGMGQSFSKCELVHQGSFFTEFEYYMNLARAEITQAVEQANR